MLGMQIHCYIDVNFLQNSHHLLVVGLVGFVVAVGHLPASAVDAGNFGTIRVFKEEDPSDCSKTTGQLSDLI